MSTIEYEEDLPQSINEKVLEELNIPEYSKTIIQPYDFSKIKRLIGEDNQFFVNLVLRRDMGDVTPDSFLFQAHMFTIISITQGNAVINFGKPRKPKWYAMLIANPQRKKSSAYEIVLENSDGDQNFKILGNIGSVKTIFSRLDDDPNLSLVIDESGKLFSKVKYNKALMGTFPDVISEAYDINEGGVLSHNLDKAKDSKQIPNAFFNIFLTIQINRWVNLTNREDIEQGTWERFFYTLVEYMPDKAIYSNLDEKKRTALDTNLSFYAFLSAHFSSSKVFFTLDPSATIYFNLVRDKILKQTKDNEELQAAFGKESNKLLDIALGLVLGSTAFYDFINNDGDLPVLSIQDHHTKKLTTTKKNNNIFSITTNYIAAAYLLLTRFFVPSALKVLKKVSSDINSLTPSDQIEQRILDFITKKQKPKAPVQWSIILNGVRGGAPNLRKAMHSLIERELVEEIEQTAKNNKQSKYYYTKEE